MKPKTKHTPLPWRLDDGGKFVRGRDGDDIAAPYGLNAAQVKANAAFIVRAVNAHEELLAALKALVADTECYCQNDKSIGLTGICPLHAAQSAIAKATEGRS